MTGPGAKKFTLYLDGWSHRSIFGSDPDAGWWAQLWPNTSTADKPDIWLGYASAISGPAQLMRRIAEATGSTDADATRRCLWGFMDLTTPRSRLTSPARISAGSWTLPVLGRPRS